MLFMLSLPCEKPYSIKRVCGVWGNERQKQFKAGCFSCHHQQPCFRHDLLDVAHNKGLWSTKKKVPQQIIWTLLKIQTRPLQPNDVIDIEAFTIKLDNIQLECYCVTTGNSLSIRLPIFPDFHNFLSETERPIQQPIKSGANFVPKKKNKLFAPRALIYGS